MNAPEGEAPAAVLRLMIAKRASISLPLRLGQVTSLIFPLIVTRESEERDVFCDCLLSLVPSPLFCILGFCYYITKLC